MTCALCYRFQIVTVQSATPWNKEEKGERLRAACVRYSGLKNLKSPPLPQSNKVLIYLNNLNTLVGIVPYMSFLIGQTT